MWHRFGDVRESFLSRLQAGEVLSWHVLVEQGMAKRYACRVVRGWKEQGLIHVARYERNHSGPPIPFYTWGAGDDAVKPKATRPRVRARKWRKENPDAYLGALMRQRAKRLMKKPPAMDPVLAALMGASRCSDSSPAGSSGTPP